MMLDTPPSIPLTASLSNKTIRPIGASSIYGITFKDDKLWAIDAKNGYLVEIDPLTNHTHILNSTQWQEFIGATGLAIQDDTLWFSTGRTIYTCSLSESSFKPEVFCSLDEGINGIGVWESTLYVSCHRQGKILVLNRETGKEITHFYAPGIGVENITVLEEELWVTDNLEQTVYCLDRATGKIIFSVLT
ncbi:MAG: transglutaminase, partial [Microcystaceae cyanobacterium]